MTLEETVRAQVLLLVEKGYLPPTVRSSEWAGPDVAGHIEDVEKIAELVMSVVDEVELGAHVVVLSPDLLWLTAEQTFYVRWPDATPGVARMVPVSKN